MFTLQLCRQITVIKFYAELQLLTKSLPKHDMVLIEGDFNACIGHGATAMTSTICKYGVGVQCVSRERFLLFAELFHEHLSLIHAFGIVENI